MYSFAGLIRRTPPPTFSDIAITDRHSDTTIFQLRAHWVRISWSIGSEKSFGHVPRWESNSRLPACKASTLGLWPKIECVFTFCFNIFMCLNDIAPWHTWNMITKWRRTEVDAMLWRRIDVVDVILISYSRWVHAPLFKCRGSTKVQLYKPLLSTIFGSFWLCFLRFSTCFWNWLRRWGGYNVR